MNASVLKSRLVRCVLGLGAVALLASVVTELRAERTVDAPYPDLRASSDPAVIDRGRYLVEGPAHCSECHGTPGARGVPERGGPLAGGFAFQLPVGTFYVPNITPDPETGIGRHTDAELARALRHGVMPDGKVMLPFMPFANLCDDDLTAVLSYLRAQKPVKHEVPEHEMNALGKVVAAYVLEPKGPSEPIRKSVTPEATAAYGRYLTHNVGNCIACHTKMDMRTGAFAGPIFGGGAEHQSMTNPAERFVSPNLTPDPRWGWLNGWSEDSFVARFQAGRVHEHSPMPWEAFQGMSETDLRAIYRYLKTLPAAPGGPDPEQRQVRVAAQ